MPPKSHVSKNDAMDENEEKSVLAGDQKPKLLFKNPKERGFRNGVRDAENTCIHYKLIHTLAKPIPG
ncbi:hypothetical protein TNCV_682431 [Trichonephila clavipes]|nr:hypothetical protein TNCV_682431 [Trichonephila clavipes]